MKQLTLRLDDDMHARLKVRAEAQHRSMHAEILHVIEAALDDAGLKLRPGQRGDGERGGEAHCS